LITSWQEQQVQPVQPEQPELFLPEQQPVQQQESAWKLTGPEQEQQVQPEPEPEPELLLSSCSQQRKRVRGTDRVRGKSSFS
jgi:hypothetical protein